VCSVDGGPDYDVPITGQSSFVKHNVHPKELDYGEVQYDLIATKEFTIENPGKVPFEFNINLSTVSRQGLIECLPMSGKVAAGEKAKILVKFFPGVPDNIHEVFLVECGHFVPERFTVKAIGTYPGCLLSFPRADNDEFMTRFDSVQSTMESGSIDYSAIFKSQEAAKLMIPIPPKFVDKEKAALKDSLVMDVEAEVDRQLLCDKIITKINQ